MILTTKQRFVLREIEAISELFGLDYSDIDQYEPDARLPRLEATKNALVRGQVVLMYTLVDELLSMRICQYFFGRKRTFQQLWRTKRFTRFNHYIIEELSLMQKLRLVRALADLPKSIVADIDRLNALRNGLAHSFFPENLKKSKPEWKGKNIFTVEGASRFQNDCQHIFDYFFGLERADSEGHGGTSLDQATTRPSASRSPSVNAHHRDGPSAAESNVPSESH